jgi:hypothetical protein
MNFLKSILISAILISVSLGAHASDADDFEKIRAEQIKKYGGTDIPKPQAITKKAEALLGKPLGEQSIKELKSIAESSNKAANYVGFIFDEYAQYYRDNYKYDFVQEKVAPFHDKFLLLSNKLKSQRNQAYLNLGKKMAASGNNIEAFFYFKDAFRLASFTDDNGEHKGIRYQAEQEMKKLMGLESIESFVYWQ